MSLGLAPSARSSSYAESGVVAAIAVMSWVLLRFVVGVIETLPDRSVVVFPFTDIWAEVAEAGVIVIGVAA
jgi:uncharacterized membrane protein